jgi:endonuclease/exonuclease/phosphatase family metal-dependent hydrolase
VRRGSLADVADSTASRLRLMTMNVLDPRYADGAARRAALGRLLAAQVPDVLALQEVVPADVDRLAAAGWHTVPHPHRDVDGVGAVLAARRPLAHVASAPLRVTGRTADTPWCGVVTAVLPAGPPFGDVLVVHHKPSWPYDFAHERELQAVEAATLAEAEARRHGVGHAVLLGDFDATPEAAGVRFWRGLQSLQGRSVCYADTWARMHPGEAGETFTPRNPLVRRGDMPEDAGRRIDYVMVRCTAHGPTLHVERCERLGVEPVDGVQISDHYGLVADLTLPDHPPGGWAGEPGAG